MRWIAFFLFVSATLQGAPLPGTPALGIFHPETITTVEGTIYRVERSHGGGVHVILKVGEDQHDVHLGPVWYLEDNRMFLRCGDPLQVTGSQVNTEQGEVMIATQIKQKSQTLLLRHQSGIPLWSRS